MRKVRIFAIILCFMLLSTGCAGRADAPDGTGISDSVADTQDTSGTPDATDTGDGSEYGMENPSAPAG